jgi:hypothetical protein
MVTAVGGGGSCCERLRGLCLEVLGLSSGPSWRPLRPTAPPVADGGNGDDALADDELLSEADSEYLLKKAAHQSRGTGVNGGRGLGFGAKRLPGSSGRGRGAGEGGIQMMSRGRGRSKGYEGVPPAEEEDF